MVILMKRPELPWPYFRGLWTGICFGLFCGAMLGIRYYDNLTTAPAAEARWALVGGLAFIAYVPDLVARIGAAMRRFHAAAK